MIIGSFTDGEKGFRGTIRTLSVETKASLVRNEEPGGNGPQFRLFAGQLEIGAAWARTSQAGNSYLSVTFDDPSLPAPVNANLTKGRDGKHILIWTRR
ncbi:MAG: DUF736 domain-containing protein [Geminicoccaceae bacterium]